MKMHPDWWLLLGCALKLLAALLAISVPLSLAWMALHSR